MSRWKTQVRSVIYGVVDRFALLSIVHAKLIIGIVYGSFTYLLQFFSEHREGQTGATRTMNVSAEGADVEQSTFGQLSITI